MNINFGYICENNFLLSLCVSLICTIVIFIDDKISKIKKPYISYGKHFVVIMVSIFGVLYLKNMNIKTLETKYDKVKMGEPDF